MLGYIHQNKLIIATDITTSLCFGDGVIKEVQAKRSRGLALCCMGGLSPTSSLSCEKKGCFCSVKSELRGQNFILQDFLLTALCTLVSPPLWIQAYLESQATEGRSWYFWCLSNFSLPTCGPLLTLLTFWPESLSLSPRRR